MTPATKIGETASAKKPIRHPRHSSQPSQPSLPMSTDSTGHQRHPEDAPHLESHVTDLLLALGEDPEREGLRDTPARVVRSYKELFRGYEMDPKQVVRVFDAENYDEMIIARDIDFFSTCEHHLLPFYGKAHIGYLPNKKIIGLSKFGRLVDIFTRRLQNQERITTQLADFLQDVLRPKGVGVVLEASHLCTIARGIEKQNARITTSAFKGYFKSNVNTRQEFLTLIHA